MKSLLILFMSSLVAIGSSAQRVAVISPTGQLLVKEGGINADWGLRATGISAVQLYSDRIGSLSHGRLSILEGELGPHWFDESDHVKAFQLSGNRIGVLLDDGVLLVKEGDIRSDWGLKATGISAFQLDGKRVAALSNGRLSVVDGSLGPNWNDVSDDVKTFQLAGTRIGVLLNNGNLLVKEGPVMAGWGLKATTISAFKLSYSMIGSLSNGRLSVKKGSLNSSWVDEADNVKAFDISIVERPQPPEQPNGWAGGGTRPPPPAMSCTALPPVRETGTSLRLHAYCSTDNYSGTFYPQNEPYAAKRVQCDIEQHERANPGHAPYPQGCSIGMTNGRGCQDVH